MQWDIWMEGFAFTETENCPASFIGSSHGNTFEDAIWNWFCKNPSNSFDETTMTYFGCRLLPNEQEARKKFG